MSLVLDCSVTLTWYFDDEKTPAADAVAARVTAEGATVPSLWRLEVANGFQSAVRRNRITAAYRDESLADLATMPITIDPETDDRAWTDTVRLVDRFRLTPYDAAYLELALRRDLPLASLDRALRTAARSVRLVLLGM